MSEYDSEAAILKYWTKYGTESIKRRWQHGSVLRKSKELFLIGATETSYEPLLGPNYIRLLKLEPGSPGSVLQCSLRQVDLTDRPVYTALSYTWKQDPTFLGVWYSIAKNVVKNYLQGDKWKIDVPQDTGELNRSKEIICNGQVIKIFPNLYNALVQLRRRRSGEYWIDALSINQNDLNERAAQVQLMGSIYQGATLVVVWLGTSLHRGSDGVTHLEHLATGTIELPPMQSIFDGKKVILPSVVGIDAEALFDAYVGAASITMSQWFRRAWVVQELCWARNVVFAMNEVEMSTKVVMKAFDIAQEYFNMVDNLPPGDDMDTNTRMGARYGPAPIMLQARETFQQGDLWTLGQWLSACSGRSATDPRDLVFAGLSLIKPEMLVIDSNLLVNTSEFSEPTSKVHVLCRQYYPQTIPRCGMRNIGRPFRKEIAEFITKPLPLIPDGLWPNLKADYTVGITELLINTAACLLTHTGTSELLSIAARTSNPEMYLSDWRIPGDNLVMEDVPSWVPVPGSWTSRVSEILTFQEGLQFSAGPRARDRPTISNDGSALFLDASQVDAIEHSILEGDFIDEMNFGKLRELLSNILNLQNAQHKHTTSLFGALSRILLCSKEQGPPQLYWRASRWFCQTLSYTVATKMVQMRAQQFRYLPRRFEYPDMTHDDFVEWIHKHHGQPQKDTDELWNLFMKVQAAYSDQQWPEWAVKTNLDMEFHRSFLQGLAKEQPPRLERNVDTSAQERKYKPPSLVQMIRDMKPKKEAEIKQNKTLGPTFEPQDPESHAHLTAVAKSALVWRKVFVTRQGYLGLGPRWLNIGDTVMVVHGAPVPYVFTPLEIDLGRREESIRAGMDKNQIKYNETVEALQNSGKKKFWKPLDAVTHNRREGKLKRLDEEGLRLQRKLDRISNIPHRVNAWILQGEVYIEGIMEGQAVGRDTRERIAVV